MKVINISGIDIKIYSGNIGVVCSGGADSSVLLYILMKNIPNTLHIFTNGNSNRGFRNITVATQVVQKCIELTNNNNVRHHVTFTKSQSMNSIFDYPFEWLNSNQIDMLYTGVTQNPPKKVYEKFAMPLDDFNADLRNPDEKKSEHPTENSYCPWTNYDKQSIAKVYKDLDLLESLYPLTRSCEWEKGDSAPDPGLGHCGECWWCCERKWAFGKL